jgi:sulfocyanin
MPRIRDVAIALAILGAATSVVATRGNLSVGSPAPAPPSAPAQVSDPSLPVVRVNQFMSYDPGARTVNIELIGAFGAANGGMNFNGGAKGDQTITVPVGWTVNMDFVNRDVSPHSAILLPDQLPLPLEPGPSAIPGAYTINVTDGLPVNGTDRMSFTASKPGSYLIVCGVPGHGPAGMYIGFVVSRTAKVPGYSR